MKFLTVTICLILMLSCKKPAGSLSTTLDKTSLTQADWEKSHTFDYLTVHFDETHVRYEINMEGQTCGIAPYTIKGNSIDIGTTGKCPGVEGYVELYTQPPRHCTYTVDEKAFEHKALLNCADMILGRVNSRPAAGEVVTIGNGEFIAMGWSPAKVREMVVFRSQPDAKSPEIRVDHGNAMNGPGPKSTTLNPDESITLIARTKEKQKIQNWENYWYYVVFQGTQQYYGWVYGEFVTRID